MKGKFSDAESYNPGASLQAENQNKSNNPLRISHTTNGTNKAFGGNQKLKMSDVRNLSDDADQVIDSLKGVDYGM